MIDVSDMINDPDFNVAFQRIQVAGSIVGGDWVPTEGAPTNMSGIVLPSKLDELKVLPEGERLSGSISVYCLTELSMGDGQSNMADIIGYDSGWYRVQYVKHYAQCALWFAIATQYQRGTTSAGSGQ